MKQKICSVKANGTIRRTTLAKVVSTHQQIKQKVIALGMSWEEYQREANLRLFMRMSANTNLNPSI
jgi:hypothetical protein